MHLTTSSFHFSEHCFTCSYSIYFRMTMYIYMYTYAYIICTYNLDKLYKFTQTEIRPRDNSANPTMIPVRSRCEVTEIQLTWWVVSTPLKKIRRLGWWFPIQSSLPGPLFQDFQVCPGATLFRVFVEPFMENHGKHIWSRQKWSKPPSKLQYPNVSHKSFMVAKVPWSPRRHLRRPCRHPSWHRLSTETTPDLCISGSKWLVNV